MIVIGVLCIAFVIVSLMISPDGRGLPSRAQGLQSLGLPLGLILIVIGLIQLIRRAIKSRMGRTYDEGPFFTP